MGRVALGVAPDTKTLAWAVVTQDRVLRVGVVRHSPKSREESILSLTALAVPAMIANSMPDIAVVEGQQVYYGSSTPPSDLLKLARITGGVEGQLHMVRPGMPVCVPLPTTWKGQVPKPIHQARVLAKYGILYEQLSEYSRPAGCAKAAQIQGADKLRPSDWKHVVDAIGLAAYGLSILS